MIGGGGSSERDDAREEVFRAYDHLRDAIVVFFGRNGVADAEDLAQEVFLRVLNKLRNGLKIERSAAQFCWRVARFVLMEHHHRRKFTDLDEGTPAPDRSILGLHDIEAAVLLDECFESLSARDLDFVRRYLNEDKKTLAAELHTNPAAMAIRFCKLKKHLENRVQEHHAGQKHTK